MVTRTEYVSDLPPAALFTPCDTSERLVRTTDDVVDELTRTRGQRDRCAEQVSRGGQWLLDATARAAARGSSAEDSPSSRP